MRIPLLLVSLTCLSVTGCPLDDDPGFDDWCGDRLCHWDLADGDIRKAPTWHDRDHGVELVGPHVTLTQRPDIASVACLEFKVIADIDPAAAVYVELDFRGDGTSEVRERIPLRVTMPEETKHSLSALGALSVADAAGRLIPVADLDAAIRALKVDPAQQMLVAAITAVYPDPAADPPPRYGVAWSQGPAGAAVELWPKSAPSCRAPSGTGAHAAVRLSDWVRRFGRRGAAGCSHRYRAPWSASHSREAACRSPVSPWPEPP